MDYRELTPRQLEVIRWMCAGKTIKQTAMLLGISVNTAKKHVWLVKKKFGAATIYRLTFLLGKAGLDEGTNAQGISR